MQSGSIVLVKKAAIAVCCICLAAILFFLFSGFTVLTIKMKAPAGAVVKIAYDKGEKTLQYTGNGKSMNLRCVFFTNKIRNTCIDFASSGDYAIERIAVENNPFIKFLFKGRDILESCDLPEYAGPVVRSGNILSFSIPEGRSMTLKGKSLLGPQKKFTVFSLFTIFLLLALGVLAYIYRVHSVVAAWIYRIPVPASCKVLILNVFILFVSAFQLAMTCGLNPWGFREVSVDSSVFLYISNLLGGGVVPYRDVFDHKGPLIYLIDYSGLQLGGDTGVWCFEILFIFAALLLVYLGLCKWYKPSVSLVISLLLSLLLYMFLGGGNYTEEYALPFIAFGFWVLSGYIRDHRFLGPWKSVALGVAAGGVILLRMNMIPVFATLALLILFQEIPGKRWKNLIMIILCGGAGLGLSMLPFIVYFMLNGALMDFVECYYRFNMQFRAAAGGSLAWNMFDVAVQPYVFIPLLFNILLLLYYMKKDIARRNLFAVNLLFFAISFIMIFGHRTFTLHYVMAFLPVIMIPAAGGIEWFFIRQRKVFYLLCICVAAALFFQSFHTRYILRNRNSEDGLNDNELELSGVIREHGYTEAAGVLVIPNECRIYRRLNYRTLSRYPYLEPVINYSDLIRNEAMGNLAKGVDSFIIFNTTYTDIVEAFFVQLDANYEQIGNCGPYIVYKYKKL